MLTRSDIRRLYLKYTAKAKDFLLSAKSREFFVFLFFFLIAGGYWLLQTLNNDYETEFSIPVRIKGIPDDVVITSEPPAEIRVRVKDKGTVLLNYMLGKSFYPITFDFADYRSKSNHVRIYAADYEKKITSQLNASTLLQTITPDTLEFYYSAGTSKKVPVRLQGRVSAGRQYYLSDTILTPDSVQVYAPRKVLDTITAAYTRPVRLENITDTLKQKVTLNAGKGVKFTPSAVNLTLPVDVYTEKSVEVPLHGINFPADKALRAFPSKVQVTFQVGMSHFHQISASDFSILVSYEELLKLGNDKYTVRLHTCPKNISHIRINPAQVDFLIEKSTTNDGY